MSFAKQYHANFYFILICFLSAINSISLQAEQVLKTDGYDIHYNAFNSTLLTPAIANQYDINRSSILGIINVSILNNLNKPITAFMEGQTKNSLSQVYELNFTKIVEGDAIYYIASFEYIDKEKLTFNINVVPVDENHRIKLNFSQQFFSD